MKHLAALQRSSRLLGIEQRRALSSLSALIVRNSELQAQSNARCRALRSLCGIVPMIRGGADTGVAYTGDRCEVQGTYRSNCLCRMIQQMTTGMYFPRCFNCGQRVGWALQAPNRPTGGAATAT